jgi:hypothetical protein
MRIERRESYPRFQDAATTSPLHKKTLKTLNKEYENTHWRGAMVHLQDPRPPEAERTGDFTGEGQNPRSILTIVHILGAHVPIRLAIILIVRFNLSYLLQPPLDRQYIAPTCKNMPNTHCT